MKSAGTMNDHSREDRYPTGRGRKHEPEVASAPLRLPLGVGGVALVGALAFGAFGLMMPTEWLETISFQLYLDQITAAAVPPLGTTAKLVAAAVLALGGAVFGWLLGKLFGVQPSSFSVHGLLNRLRGIGSDDEHDAPSLRAADRHPDAPARRPFSAARDIARPDDDWDDDDEDALLLDMQADPADDLPVVPPLGATSGTSFDQLWTKVVDEPAGAPLATPAADADMAAVSSPEAPVTPCASAFDAPLDSVSLPAPSLDDWEMETQPVVSSAQAPFPPSAPVPPPAVHRASAPVEIAAPLAAPVSAPAPLRASLPPVEPLDLSAARLDDLLARLESGLGRRGSVTPPVAAAAAVAGLSAARPEGSEAARAVPSPVAEAEHRVVGEGQGQPAAKAASGEDPSYPYDPALAAALKTLRRLNQQATV